MAHKGFTLVELLVVMVIIGMVMVLAPAAFRQVLPVLELKAAARDVASTMRAARGRAIAQNREIALVVDLEQRTLRADDTAEVAQLGQDLEISMLTGQSEQLSETSGQFRFFPDGTATGGRLTLARDGDTYHIVLDWLTGHAALEQ